VVPSGQDSSILPARVDNHSKMVEHRNLHVSFVAVVALWTLVTLLIKLIRKLLKWKYILQDEIMPFWPLRCESEAMLYKKFRPGYLGWSVHEGKFHPGYASLKVTRASYYKTCLLLASGSNEY